MKNLREQSIHPDYRVFTGITNRSMIEPLDYAQFLRPMNQSAIILTDLGGTQEEAPSLGKPVLVMREDTDQTEAVEAR